MAGKKPIKGHGLLAVLILLYGFIFPANCPADQAPPPTGDCITKFETGAVNWSTGVVTASGKALPADQSQSSKESVSLSARAEAAKIS
nr:hypothetical protein [Desulfobacula sp.]